MSNINQLQYFASQTYRQVQLSVGKGTKAYPYSDFAHQFDALLEASGNEAFTRRLTIKLVEEAAGYEETTDYLRQEMAFETEVAAVGDRNRVIDQANDRPDAELTKRRLHRQESELIYDQG